MLNDKRKGSNAKDGSTRSISIGITLSEGEYDALRDYYNRVVDKQEETLKHKNATMVREVLLDLLRSYDYEV